MRNIYKLAILLLSLVITQTAFADVKIKSKQTVSGQSYENTTYIKGKRQRTESMNGMMINLNQCDLQRGIQINPQTKTYIINEYQQDTTTTAAKPGAPAKTDGVVRAGGVITTTLTVKDTGERKQMFGFTAKHLIITMETASSPDACTKTNSKIQTDGWYIDAEFVLDCQQNSQYTPYNPRGAKPTCQDKYQMKQVGTTKRGYPVYEKMTMFDETGKETMTMVNEVVELSKAALEAGLFDVPEGYRQVSDAAQMYSASSSSSSMSSSSSSMGMRSGVSTSSSTNGVAGSLSKLSQGCDDDDGPATVGAKKQGTVRIGLAAVKTGAVGEGVNASELSAAIQNSLTQYLKVPNVEVVTLDARLSSAIESEARQKECDYVLYINAAHKKGGGGGFGMFSSVIAPAVGRVGIGHTGSVAGNIAGQAATQAIVSAGSASASIKPKDELTIDVKLQQMGGAAVLARQFKKKASSNGEDIISPVVEQAATAIVDTIGK
jgi:hypothetical protein